MMLIKPTILTEDDLKEIKFQSTKKDWTRFLDFLYGMLLSGIAGASVGFTLFLLTLID